MVNDHYRSANIHIALSVRSIANAIDEQHITDQEMAYSLSEIRGASFSTIELVKEKFQRFALPTGSFQDVPEMTTERHTEEEDSWSDSQTTVQTYQLPSPPSTTQSVTKRFDHVSAWPLQFFTSCRCVCHSRYNIKTPKITSSLFGRFTMSYTGATTQTAQCSSEMCRAHKGFTLKVIYSAPHWLWFRMVHILCSSVGDPKFVASFPKVISQDSAIFEMARLGDMDGMKKAFSHHWASPLVVTEHRETLIQEAIHNGFPEVARFLIQLGADPGIDNDSGVLPAQEAWDYILRKGFDTAILEQYRTLFSLTEDDLEDRGFTIIHKLVLELIPSDDFAIKVERNRALINVVDSTGRTAAHWATLRNEAGKLRTLLEFGASPHIKDTTWGNTPLDYSVRCPSARLTRILLEFGADFNSRTTCKWTPLYGCATYRKSKIAKAHVANARLLVKAGADIDLRDEDGVDPLMKAARQEVPLLAEYLIDEAGIPMTNKDNMGLTALAYSIRRQSAQTLKVILDKGADYTLKDNRGNTILHAAAVEGDLETLNVLTCYDLHGVDPDEKNIDGMMATELAVKREDMPDGFMPVFTKMLAGIRATRYSVRNQRISEANRRIEKVAIRTTARKVEEVQGSGDKEHEDDGLDDEDEESDEFHDALEDLMQSSTCHE